MRPDPRDLMMLVTPLLLAAAILVTGCTPDAARWTPAEAPKQNKVEFVAMPHQVRFAPNAATPANGEEKSLADFLVVEPSVAASGEDSDRNFCVRMVRLVRIGL